MSDQRDATSLEAYRIAKEAYEVRLLIDNVKPPKPLEMVESIEDWLVATGQVEQNGYPPRTGEGLACTVFKKNRES